jgi:Tol biopolymer transport system component
MMGRRLRGTGVGVLLSAGAACLLFMAGTSKAAFPGANGRIVFEGGGALQTINADGTGLATIPSTETAGLPVWSKDGTKIAFQMAGDVWSINPDGTNAQNLTGVDSGSEPSWSPDGTRIAYSKGNDIWLMNADGGNQHFLTNDGSTDRTPSFSPDGTRIAFVSNRGGDTQVWSMSDSGSTPIPVSTVGDVEFERPSWSPDGGRIAFAVDPGSFVEIYTAAASGGDDMRMTFNSEGSLFNDEPAWSPDGTKIAFDSTRLLGGGTGPRQIWVMGAAPDPMSTGATQVTTTGGRHPDWETLLQTQATPPHEVGPTPPHKVGPPVPPNFSTAIFQKPFLYLRLKCPARFKPRCVGRAAAVISKDRRAKQITSSVSAMQKPTKWKVARLKVKPRFLSLVAKMAKTPNKKLLNVRQLIHSARFRGGQTQAVYHIYRVRTAGKASR